MTTDSAVACANEKLVTDAEFLDVKKHNAPIISMANIKRRFPNITEYNPQYTEAP